MTVTLNDVRARLDPAALPAFAAGSVNLPQAGVKAGEMNKHLAEAASLIASGHREDAHNRYDAALVAGAGALMALLGVRLVNEFKGRRHWASMHFLSAALQAHDQPCPPIEILIDVTRVRSWVDYDASIITGQLTPQRSDEARQACDMVRRSMLAVLPSAVSVPVYPTQKP